MSSFDELVPVEPWLPDSHPELGGETYDIASIDENDFDEFDDEDFDEDFDDDFDEDFEEDLEEEEEFEGIGLDEKPDDDGANVEEVEDVEEPLEPEED